MIHTMKYVWFSRKQAAITGTAIWKNAQGWPIELTMLTEDSDHGSKWDDIECRGIVVEFAHEHTSGLCWHLQPEEPKGDACLSYPTKSWGKS